MRKMKLTVIKQVMEWRLLMALAMVFIMASCGGNDKVGDTTMISGNGSKTWTASKELDAAGNKDKLTSEEKAQTMQFYSDGRFALGGGGSLETGTWTYDQSGKRLSLTFQDASMSQNFNVEQLTEKEMRLKAADGSEMQLKAQ